MTPENQSRRLVSIRQACELAGVTRRTLYNWMQANKVEYVYTAGGSRRIVADTLFRENTSTAPVAPFPQGPLVPPEARGQLRMAKSKPAWMVD